MEKRIAEFISVLQGTELEGFDVKAWITQYMAYILSGHDRPKHPSEKINGGVRPPHPH